jgi:hypothetical protein
VPDLLAALKNIMRHMESEFTISGGVWATSVRADCEAAEALIAKLENRLIEDRPIPLGRVSSE